MPWMKCRGYFISYFETCLGSSYNIPVCPSYFQVWWRLVPYRVYYQYFSKSKDNAKKSLRTSWSIMMQSRGRSELLKLIRTSLHTVSTPLIVSKIRTSMKWAWISENFPSREVAREQTKTNHYSSTDDAAASTRSSLLSLFDFPGAPAWPSSWP